MIRLIRQVHAARSTRRGLTLAEMLVSMLLVGLTLASALETLGAVKMAQMRNSRRNVGQLLAQELLSEIMRQDYADPETSGQIDLRDLTIEVAPLSVESGESNLTRADFDDVDDYHGWSASPPQMKDGTLQKDLPDWQRAAQVERLDRANLTKLSASESGLKRITVSVGYKGAPIAQVSAIKGAGLPPAPPAPSVMLLVRDEAALTPGESARKALMESWGFSVTLMRVSKTAPAFTTAEQDVDAAYVPMEIDPVALGDKLATATIGVVIEEMMDQFGICQDWETYTLNQLTIVNDTHYITSTHALGDVVYLSRLQSTALQRGKTAPGLVVLGQAPNSKGTMTPALTYVEKGGELANIGPAPGRRVQLPWGFDTFEFDAVNSDGQTIMKRAIEWAAGMERN